ncbi:hypothetical protein [Actinoplanes sp. NPDC049802]|uniref:hypothetical protein n=1 Tax=Actinoplanes sp. NPDC049802 TaxID=3154742 RepID=UPI0034056C2B
MIRPLLVVYAGLGGALAADGRPWLAGPLCLVALHAIGELWIRALPGVPAETGVPAVRAGLAAVTGLVTLPLVALLLHLAGFQVRPVPLVAGTATTATLLGAAILLRARLATRRAATRTALPSQRSHAAALSPGHPPAGPGADQPSTGTSTGTSTGHPPAGPVPGSAADDASGDSSSGRSPADPSADQAPAEDTSDHSSDRPSAGHSPSEEQTTEIAGHPSAEGAIMAGDPQPDQGYARTAAIVGVPVMIAVAVGAVAVRAYLAAPHPAEPGYLSVALNGWAAAIDRPVTVPVRGLSVPVLVTSAGLDAVTTPLQLRVGGQIVASKPLTVAADSVRSLTVHVPALPPDGCLRAIDISVGATSTGFYARGPRTAGQSAVRGGAPAGPALSGPGVHDSTTVGDPSSGAAHDPTSAGGSADAGGAAVVPGLNQPGVRAGSTDPGAPGTTSVPGERPAGPVRAGVVPGKGSTGAAGEGSVPGKRPAGPLRPGVVPGERPAGPVGAGALPGKRGTGSAQTRPDAGRSVVAPGKKRTGDRHLGAASTKSDVVPGKRPASSVGAGVVPGKRPASSVGAGVVPGKRPASSVGAGVVPGKRPAVRDGASHTAVTPGTTLVPGKRPASSVNAGVVPGKRPASSVGAGVVPGKRPASSAGAGVVPGKRPASSAGAGAVPGKNQPGTRTGGAADGKRPGVNGRFVDPGFAGVSPGGGNGSNVRGGAVPGPASAGEIREGVPGRFADPGPVGTGGMGGGTAVPAGTVHARAAAPTLERVAC